MDGGIGGNIQRIKQKKGKGAKEERAGSSAST